MQVFIHKVDGDSFLSDEAKQEVSREIEKQARHTRSMPVLIAWQF
jgi:hypothetical protein